MTFTIKVRGAGLIIAEYRCHLHGVFEETVSRDENGDPPPLSECPFVINEDGYGDDGETWCMEQSPHIISAPKVRNLTVLPTAVVKGGDTERRPGMLDTRPLAEGMPITEWKKMQKGITEDRWHKQMIAKGLKSKRIQVG